MYMCISYLGSYPRIIIPLLYLQARDFIIKFIHATPLNRHKNMQHMASVFYKVHVYTIMASTCLHT